MKLIAWSRSSRSLTESIASIRLTEKCRPISRSISIQLSLVSHSALSGMIASDLPSPNSRKRENTCLMPSLLRSISSIERIFRVSSLPEGSPTWVVPPPISAIGRLPVFCSKKGPQDRHKGAEGSERRVAVETDIGGQFALGRQRVQRAGIRNL